MCNLHTQNESVMERVGLYQYAHVRFYLEKLQLIMQQRGLVSMSDPVYLDRL